MGPKDDALGVIWWSHVVAYLFWNDSAWNAESRFEIVCLGFNLF